MPAIFNTGDRYGGVGGEASTVALDNSANGLRSSNVQDAINEIAEDISELDSRLNVKSASFTVTTGGFGETIIHGNICIIAVATTKGNVMGIPYEKNKIAFRTITTLEAVANTSISGTYYYIEL